MRAARRKWLLSLRVLFLRAVAGALCRGGTSESVRMLREMATEEVGRGLAPVCYISVVSRRGWD